MTEKKPPEGWGTIRPGDRKAHYYRNRRSLCGRIGFYFGPLEPHTGFILSQDCAACVKKMRAEGFQG